MHLPESIYSGKWTGGHCQGIALDSRHEYVYYAFTTMLVKTDLHGRVVGTVKGLLGHLGCIAFCEDDGRVYGSLEYKHDAIGKGILRHMGSDTAIEDGFYIAIFDVNKIDRMDMDACADGVMTCAHLDEVLADYQAQTPCGPHRHGCSGIDGTTFAPIPGSSDAKKYLFVAYGVYDDVNRPDNDYQVLLCYDRETLVASARPLSQKAMHHTGPAAPLHKFFVHTGNTNYGVQNLEYDPATGDLLMAVYPGHKPAYPNHAMFAVNGSIAPHRETLQGVTPAVEGEVLTLRNEGWAFPYGNTGLYALGDGRFYVSHDSWDGQAWDTTLRLYHWDGETPMKP